MTDLNRRRAIMLGAAASLPLPAAAMATPVTESAVAAVPAESQSMAFARMCAALAANIDQCVREYLEDDGTDSAAIEMMQKYGFSNWRDLVLAHLVRVHVEGIMENSLNHQRWLEIEHLVLRQSKPLRRRDRAQLEFSFDKTG